MQDNSSRPGFAAAWAVLGCCPSGCESEEFDSHSVREEPAISAPLAQKLAYDGIECLGVPAKLVHRVRMLSTGHGRKNDQADALSIGIAALMHRTSIGAHRGGPY